MAAAAAIVAGCTLVVVGVILAVNFRGVGGRVATFGGAITFPFDGGKTLRKPRRAYRAWGVVLVVAGLVVTALGVGNLAGWTDAAKTAAGAGLASADRAACARATPLQKTVARLAHFEITGGAGSGDQVVTAPLWPNFPSALAVGKFGIAPTRRLASPVTLTAFNCRDGSPVRLFSFVGTKTPTIPRLSPARVVERAGFASVTLTWPPPISSPPDPPKWLVIPFFYNPGLAVVRFTQQGRVIDRLTFRVCVARPDQTCR